MKKLIFLSIFIVFVFCSCNHNPAGKDYTDTPTSGDVNVSVDESYKLILDTQAYTFEALYPNAKVHLAYKPENEALADLLNDSAKVAVINRELNAQENEVFKKANIFPKTTKIAEDAIAIIINPENTDSNMTVDRLKQILLGIDTLWNKEKKEKINVVFDNPNSANYRYMQHLIADKPFGKNCFAVKSNPEVIAYVSAHLGAMGILSVNWISDRDDTLSQSFLKKIRLVGLSANAQVDEDTKFRKPWQAYIANKEYPLCRDVYMINRQTRAGLGTGFVSFVAGEKGQRMMKIAGLIPATMQVRLIQVTK
jgi:phosphate transport system substrate-binding protein